jgi:hypothetical protein
LRRETEEGCVDPSIGETVLGKTWMRFSDLRFTEGSVSVNVGSIIDE